MRPTERVGFRLSKVLNARKLILGFQLRKGPKWISPVYDPLLNLMSALENPSY